MRHATGVTVLGVTILSVMGLFLLPELTFGMRFFSVLLGWPIWRSIMASRVDWVKVSVLGVAMLAGLVLGALTESLVVGMMIASACLGVLAWAQEQRIYARAALGGAFAVLLLGLGFASGPAVLAFVGWAVALLALVVPMAALTRAAVLVPVAILTLGLDPWLTNGIIQMLVEGIAFVVYALLSLLAHRFQPLQDRTRPLLPRFAQAAP